jgi:hypothetical protein
METTAEAAARTLHHNFAVATGDPAGWLSILTDRPVRAAAAGQFRALPYDYLHPNSVGLAADGNIILSARHTWAATRSTVRPAS